MQRPQRAAVALVALGMLVSGCYGPFHLTRRVWKFNGEVSDNKWVVEVVHLVCIALPVYGIATLADGLIFNSIEFWTGENPLTEDAKADGSTTRRIVRGDSEAILTRVASSSGDALVIEQFRHGQPVSTLRFQRDGEGTVALNGDGAALFRAKMLADGRLVITDAAGTQVASYSEREAKDILASLPQ